MFRSAGGSGVLWWLYVDHRNSVNATLPANELQVAKDNQQALLIYAIGATVCTVWSPAVFGILLLFQKLDIFYDVTCLCIRWFCCCSCFSWGSVWLSPSLCSTWLVKSSLIYLYWHCNPSGPSSPSCASGYTGSLCSCSSELQVHQHKHQKKYDGI